MTVSEIIKKAGLASLKEFGEIIKRTPNQVRLMYKNNPDLFMAALFGAVYIRGLEDAGYIQREILGDD